MSKNVKVCLDCFYLLPTAHNFCHFCGNDVSFVGVPDGADSADGTGYMVAVLPEGGAELVEKSVTEVLARRASERVRKEARWAEANKPYKNSSEKWAALNPAFEELLRAEAGQESHSEAWAAAAEAYRAFTRAETIWEYTQDLLEK